MFEIIMQYVLSGITALSIWTMGNKSPLGPAIGLGSQILWLTYVLMTRQFGLLPGIILLTVINGRNLIKWIKENHQNQIKMEVKGDN